MRQAQQSKWFVRLGDTLVPCGTHARAERQFDSLTKERPVVSVALVKATPQGMQEVRTYADGVERRTR